MYKCRFHVLLYTAKIHIYILGLGHRNPPLYKYCYTPKNIPKGSSKPINKETGDNADALYLLNTHGISVPYWSMVVKKKQDIGIVLIRQSWPILPVGISTLVNI